MRERKEPRSSWVASSNGPVNRDKLSPCPTANRWAVREFADGPMDSPRCGPV